MIVLEQSYCDRNHRREFSSRGLATTQHAWHTFYRLTKLIVVSPSSHDAVALVTVSALAMTAVAVLLGLSFLRRTFRWCLLLSHSPSQNDVIHQYINGKLKVCASLPSTRRVETKCCAKSLLYARWRAVALGRVSNRRSDNNTGYQLYYYVVVLYVVVYVFDGNERAGSITRTTPCYPTRIIASITTRF